MNQPILFGATPLDLAAYVTAVVVSTLITRAQFRRWRQQDEERLVRARLGAKDV